MNNINRNNALKDSKVLNENALLKYYHFPSGVPFFYVGFCEIVHLELWQNVIFIEAPNHKKRQMVETGQN